MGHGRAVSLSEFGSGVRYPGVRYPGGQRTPDCKKMTSTSSQYVTKVQISTKGGGRIKKVKHGRGQDVYIHIPLIL